MSEPSAPHAPDLDSDAWLRARAGEAFERLVAVAERWAWDDAQQSLLVRALRRAKPSVIDVHFGPARLPLLTYLAAGGRDEDRALVGAMIGAAFWAGAELLDDAADGDLDPEWLAVSAAEISFAGFALSTLLPPLVLAEAALVPEVRQAAQALIGRESLAALAGQALDLEQRGGTPEPDEVERAAVGKNGAPHALFAGLGAILAGATDARRDAFVEYGRALGVLRQLNSDLHEVIFSEDARDLRQDNRPLLVAMALEASDETTRFELLDLLRRSVDDPRALAEARRRLRAPRTLFPFLQRAARWAERAWAELEETDAGEPARSRLDALVEERAPRCAGRPPIAEPAPPSARPE